MHISVPLFFRLLLACLLLAPAAQASEGNTPQVSYINMIPSLVGNYDPGSRRLKFYKADIALRASNEHKATIEMHEPLIRDQLILLFAQKTEEDFASLEGKEALRQDALLHVQQALQQEAGEPLVDDLLFNNLVIQR